VNVLTWLLNKYGRSLATKCLTRLILWGGAVAFAKLGVDSPSADTAAQVGDWIAAVVCALLAALLDRWHHKTDNSLSNAVTTLNDAAQTSQTAEDVSALQSALANVRSALAKRTVK